MLKSVHIVLTASLVVLLIAARSACAAEITVFSDTPLAPALKPIADAFQRDSGHQVKFVFGLSPAIHKRLTDGEVGDVAIIQPNFIEELIRSGKIAAGQYQPIVRVGIGLFTRAGAEVPDVSTVEAFKRSLLGADTLVFSNVAAGNYFATVLERLGIGGSLKERIVRASPPEVVARVVQGKGKDIGVMVATLIKADGRLKLIGTLPAEFQSYLVYVAAPLANAGQPVAAREFISFLSRPESKTEFVSSGAE
jgi:molybdate transport system substrate-binding protein